MSSKKRKGAASMAQIYFATYTEALFHQFNGRILHFWLKMSIMLILLLG